MQDYTAYRRLPRWSARFLILALAVLVLIPALPHRTLNIPGERKGWGDVLPGYTDLTLYRDIVFDVAQGQDYYAAAAKEQRAHKYPTAPAIVFREPALAWLLVLLHFSALQYAALFAIYAAVLVGLYREVAGRPIAIRIATVAAAVSGLSIAGVPNALYFHEVWAALLIAASLVFYRTDRWWPSLLLGLFACLVRELAAPYLLAMLAFALLERRWREAAAWTGAIAIFAGLFGLHLARAAALYRPGDLVTHSWLAWAGWNFVVVTVKWNFALKLLPSPVVAFAACASVLGFAGSPDGRARRAALVVAGYLAAFTVVGRPDNYYWGILFAPLVPLGWLYAPAAFRDIFQRAGLTFARARG